MDWTAAVQAAQDEHDGLCVVTGCDWRYCPRTTPVPEMARRLGLLVPLVTLADRERELEASVTQPRPDLDAAWCACGQKRRGHSVDGSRCFHCADCQAAGGYRPVEDSPGTPAARVADR